MVMKIYDEVTVCQRRLELSETEETKLEKYCFLEVRINLWYWLRRDLKEDLSRAEWVRYHSGRPRYADPPPIIRHWQLVLKYFRY